MKLRSQIQLTPGTHKKRFIIRLLHIKHYFINLFSYTLKAQVNEGPE